MGNTPEEDATKKAKRSMHKAVDIVIDEKKKAEIGTKEAEADVAADFHAAAQEGTWKRGRQHREKGGEAAAGKSIGAQRMGTSTHCVTQITVVETDPEKQAEALGVMTERARFMARQPGFVSISVHRSLDGRRIVNYIQWESRKQLQSAHKSPQFRKEWRHFDDLTDEIDPHLHEVVEVMESRVR